MKVKCIHKVRNKNKQIVKYVIEDSCGNIRSIEAKQLKLLIIQKGIEVVNLKLTSDNRLIDCKSGVELEDEPQGSVIITREIINVINCGKSLSFKSNANLNSIVTKAKVMKLKITKLDIGLIPLIVVESPEEIKIVSDRQIELETVYYNTADEVSGLFMYSSFKHIDLRETDTSKAINMNSMFAYCKAESIIFGGFNTSQVTDMNSMFYNCKAKSLNLSGFDTSNVVNMRCMFEYCEAQQIELSSFNTSKVINMNSMFAFCKAQHLDLRSFDVSKVKAMFSMFWKCESKLLILSSFSVLEAANTKFMFKHCTAEVQATDPKIIEAINEGKQGEK